MCDSEINNILSIMSKITRGVKTFDQLIDGLWKNTTK